MGHQETIHLLVLALVTLTHVLGQNITVTKVTGCGSTVGCLSDCQGSSCGFIVSWNMNGSNAIYTVTSSVDPNAGAWIAVAFSNDSKMQDDDVIGCTRDVNGTTIAVFSATTPLHRRPILYNDTDLSLTSSSYNNGVLSCTFQRPVGTSPTNTRVNLDSSWTLLFAKGQTNLNVAANEAPIGYHGRPNRKLSEIQVKVSDKVDVNATDPPSETTQQLLVTKVPGCGSTVGCYSDCQGNNCNFIVSWTVNGGNATYTVTSSVTQNPGAWIAFAFSTDNFMKDDDVIGCTRDTNGRVLAFSARTPEHAPPVIYNDAELMLISQSYNNSVLSCTLQRPVGPSSTNQRVNLDNAWTLLFAKGPATFDASTNQTTIGYHENDKKVSTAQVKVSEMKDIGATDAQPTQAPPTGTVPKLSGCGQSFGCFSNCIGQTCGFIMTWEKKGNTTGEFTLTAYVAQTSGSWLAIGFSDDDKMGGDDVLGCATNKMSIVHFSAKNPKQATPTFYNDTEVQLVSSEYKDNVLTCKISRPINESTFSSRFSLTTSWTILFAMGSATLSATNQPNLEYHSGNKYITGKQVNIGVYEDLGAKSSEYPLVKAHGSLMIVAWIFLASIGIVLARYYKPAWKSLMCSEKVWFQMHRICMILVFFTTAAGFIIIFIEVDGYSNIQEDRSFLVGHPIIGIIVMILTVLNPVMALFRCHPGTPKRPIFNWAHWFVGTSAHILGVVNIFFGVLLTKSDVPYYLVYILGAYVAWQIFVELLLEAITCLAQKTDRSEAYELSSGDHQKQKIVSEESNGIILIKRIILIVHCIIVAAFAAVLIGLLATGREELE